MPKILIVDDDVHLRKLVRTYADLEGYRSVEAESGAAALDILHKADFDLIILDVMMPGIDGFEALAQIREISEDVPVIMLTSRTEEYDRLFGFNLGADDYVPKPFSPKELMARIKAVLKRSRGNPDDKLRFGTLTIEPKARVVMVGEASVALPPKEFELLLYLAQNERIVLTRDQLLSKVWGYEYGGDSRTVDTHVKSLRDHLGEYRKTIQTVWGVGYKFEYKEA
jgi:DNA-binding response OmpR family regulator